MNRPHSRQLLLEQLESRSLLAGGSFAFSQPADMFSDDTAETARHHNNLPANIDEPFSSNAGRPAAHNILGLRGAVNDASHWPEPGRRPGPPPRMLAVEVVTPLLTNQPRDLPAPVAARTNSNTSDQLRISAPPARDPIVASLTVAIRIITKAETTATPVLSNANSVRETNNLRPSANPLPVDLTNLATSRSRGDETPSILNAQPSSRDSVAANGSRTGEQAKVSAQSRELMERKFESASIARISQSPLLDWQPNTAVTQEPWEIPGNTLRGLRDISKQDIDADSAKTDLAIAMWFDGPGGLIDFTVGDQPIMQMNPIDRIVEVGLDATLGQHRSLELIAAIGEHGASDQDLRSAVLDAIVRANRETLPVAEDRTSAAANSLGVSGAVVVAGVAALAARRKRNNVFQSKSLLQEK